MPARLPNRLAVSVSILLLARGSLATPEAATPTSAAVEDTGRKSERLSDAQRQAEEHRQRALRLFDQGNFAAARTEFERAHQLAPSFRLLYNLGVVSLALGDSAGASDFLERFLRDGGDAVQPALRAEVQRQLADLVEHVTTVFVDVDTAGAQVFIDNRLVGTGPLSQSIRVNAGLRQISARTKTTSATQVVDLRGGATIRVNLHLVPTALPPPLSQQPQASSQVALWVGWGSSAALAAGMLICGLKALSAQREYERSLDRIESRSELDRKDAVVLRWSIAADAFGAGALATAGYSLYLTLTSSSSSQRSRSRPETIGVQFEGYRATVFHRF